MDPIFTARCNCLYKNKNVSAENLEQLAGQVQKLGIPLCANTITSSIERIGNWVGGQVVVFQDKVVFSMNQLNAAFQEDTSDVVVPISMISDVKIGKMLMVAKTVDCDFMGEKLRFRCNGKNNERLIDAINSVANKP